MKIDGKELVVTPASFSDAMALQKAVLASVKLGKVDLSGLTTDIVKESKDGGIDLSSLDFSKLSGIAESIFTMILEVSTSPEVEAYLYKCAEKAVFGEKRDKVDKDLFEDVENRKYYYPIMIEVLKVNVGPFFGLANSAFTGIMSRITSTLKS